MYPISAKQRTLEDGQMELDWNVVSIVTCNNEDVNSLNRLKYINKELSLKKIKNCAKPLSMNKCCKQSCIFK